MLYEISVLKCLEKCWHIIGSGIVLIQLILINLFRQWHFRKVPPMQDRIQWSCACSENYDTEHQTMCRHIFNINIEAKVKLVYHETHFNGEYVS